MVRRAAYEPVLSGKALTFLSTLAKRNQRRLIDLLFRLAEYPHQLGDYASFDECGRHVQHLVAGPLVISYWPDHAVRELRISDIEAL